MNFFFLNSLNEQWALPLEKSDKAVKVSIWNGSAVNALNFFQGTPDINTRINTHIACFDAQVFFIFFLYSIFLLTYLYNNNCNLLQILFLGSGDLRNALLTI